MTKGKKPLMQRFVKIEDRFYPGAAALRAEFDRRFRDPKATRSDRFVWDYWHVPDQYTFMRTPAYHYFAKSAYAKLHRFLVDWGRCVLGCREISPPWLSYYVEGCGQDLHSDVPHGPWAFVFSLTKGKKFTGGETRILRPETLDYWSSFSEAKDRELSSFETRIPSPFNRLTVFDPRFPHGVSEVRGVKDPREGRLVVHGWFTEPRPYCEGSLPAKNVEGALNEGLFSLEDMAAKYGRMHGCMSVRTQIGAAGTVRGVSVLANSVILLDTPSHERRVQAFVGEIVRIFKRMKFPRAKGGTRVTVPLLFR